MSRLVTLFSLVAVFGLACCHPAHAVLITHTPGDRVPPVVVSPPFGTLAAGGTLGTNYIAFGVDYTFGGIEGIFSDNPPLAFGGVNGSNVVDLLAPVDGRIVALNTTAQGLTNTVSVVAGDAAAGTLTLSVFDIGGNLLQSVANGSSGVSTFGITRLMFDIAFFRVSTNNDTFGVQSVTIETPVRAAPAAGVPAPASALLLAFGGISALGLRLRRKSA